MIKVILVLALVFYLVFGIPRTGSGAASHRKKTYMVGFVLLALTGSIFYLMKMLKIAVVLWIALLLVVYFWFSKRSSK